VSGAVRRRREENLVPGEYALTLSDFRTIAALLYADSGIHLEESKAALVYSRLSKRLRARGLSSFDAYCRLLQSGEAPDERAALLSALTTNVTRFFREPHHFDALRLQLRDHLAPLARAGGRVRLWSAACSLGHEPYSMAMCVLAELPEAADLDLRILATDIDPQVTARARKGEYSREDVAPIPSELLALGTERRGEEALIRPEVKRLISFGVLNLHAEWPMRGRFDAVFCRNVAIYFDDETQRRLWRRLGERLTPHGRLYIGHSERIDDPSLTTDGLTIYRRSDA
jgi:chemotaxis protein methyltransferase CheR